MPVITLLKRQLALAVKEEDYREAARLRDHSWWGGEGGAGAVTCGPALDYTYMLAWVLSVVIVHLAVRLIRTCWVPRLP
jgi:hypothetical protein